MQKSALMWNNQVRWDSSTHVIKEIGSPFWFCVVVVSAIHLFNKQLGMFWEIMNIDHKIDHLLRNRLREIVYPINCNFWFVIYIFQFRPPLPEALLLSRTPRERLIDTGWNFWKSTKPVTFTIDCADLHAAAAAAKLLQSYPTLQPKTAAHQAPLSLGFSRQEHWSGLPFPSPMHESEKWKWSHSVMSNSSQPHGLQPTRPLCPWDFPGKSTRVGCHCLLRQIYIAYNKRECDWELQTCCLLHLWLLGWNYIVKGFVEKGVHILFMMCKLAMSCFRR